MERENNVVDLQQFRMAKSINCLIAKATKGKYLDTSFLYDVYNIDPDILIGISLDPYCDEAFHSLYARYRYSHIIENSGAGITVLFSVYPVIPMAVLSPMVNPDMDVHNIIIGSGEFGLNFIFVCGDILSTIQSIEGLWISDPASSGYLLLDYNYMIARNLEILQSDMPSDKYENGLKLVHYLFRIKEGDHGKL